MNETLLGRPLVIACAVGYLLVVLGIGMWAARRTRSPRDYFIAGQRLGLFVTGLGTMASAFSGFVFLGGPGLTYRLGLSSLWIVLPVGFTAGLLCWVLAKRLWWMASAREVYTVPDAVACRYGNRVTTALSALAVAMGSISYLAAQLLAMGVLLQTIFGLESLAVAMALGLVVLLSYSTLGGMVAGMYTDLVQGALMLGAAVLLCSQAVSAAGGWERLTGSLRESALFGGEFLEPFGGASPSRAFGLFFVFGIGVLGQPHMVHKFFMLADPRRIRHLPWVLGASQVVCLLVWLGVGLAVPALVAQGALDPLTRADDAAPTFLLRYASDTVAGLFLAGVLAAIMSTADSLLNIGSAAIVRDLPRALKMPLNDELSWARAATVMVGIAAAAIGLAYGDLIALLGTLAFGTFGAALAPSLAVGMLWHRVPASAASASIATGLLASVLLELSTRPGVPAWLAALRPPPDVLPAAVSLALSFTVLFVVTGVRWRTARVPSDPELIAVIAGAEPQVAAPRAMG